MDGFAADLFDYGILLARAHYGPLVPIQPSTGGAASLSFIVDGMDVERTHGVPLVYFPDTRIWQFPDGSTGRIVTDVDEFCNAVRRRWQFVGA